MDRIGGFTVILTILLLPGFEPWPCRAQPLSPTGTTIPPPGRGSYFAAVQQKRPALVPTDLHGPRTLEFPAARTTVLETAAREPADPGLRINFAAAFQPPSPSASPAPTVRPSVVPPPRHITLPGESTTRFVRASRRRPRRSVRELRSSPFEDPNDLGFPINLATRLAASPDARPLIVAAARTSRLSWVAEAQLTHAKVLWVPTLTIGGDYIRHDGGGPDFNKGVLTAPSVNYFYAGGGLNVSNSGLFQFINLTDVFFEPLIAQRVLNSRQWDIQTAKNDALLMTADTYFRVHQHRGMYAGALYCVERGRDLVEQIASLSGELVSRVEVERARNLLADLEQQSVSARQAWRVQSAKLTRILRLNPRAVVVPLEHDHLQLTLIDPGQPLPTYPEDCPDHTDPISPRSTRAGPGGNQAEISREKLRSPPRHHWRLPE